MNHAKSQRSSEGFTKGKLNVDWTDLTQRAIAAAFLLVMVGVLFGMACASLYLFALLLKFLVFISVSAVSVF